MQEMAEGKEREAEVGDVNIPRKENVGLFEALPQHSSMIMVAINGSKNSRYALKWALNAFPPEGKLKFRLYYVCPPVTSIPTPMGNRIPISQVREDVVTAYRKDVELQTLSMLFPYKEICMRKTVDFELSIKEADNVAEAIAEDIWKFNISRLVIGDSSRNLITRKLKGIKLSAKISDCAPSFCTVLVIKKGRLSAVRTGTEEISSKEGVSMNSSYCYSISCSDTLQKSSLRVNIDEIPSIIGYMYNEMESPCSTIHSRSSSSNSDDDGSVLALPASEMHYGKSKISSYRNYRARTRSWSSDLSSMSDNESTLLANEVEKVKPELIYVHEMSENAHQEPNVVSREYKKYTWEEIEAATLSFSDSLKIGAGANGTVYRGTFLDTDAAVKILNSNEERETKQLKQEIEILSRIRHSNILLLLDACLEKGCLVYEYMENGSLDDRLHCRDNSPPLPWTLRLKIAWEVASALIFLHHSSPPIIHRDLKPANILLDANFRSKIGDVGLSTLLPSTKLSLLTLCKDTAPVGTFFFIDPEYQRTGLVSPKSDTYALGVVILQLLTGKQPMGLAYSVETAMEDGVLMEILDDKAGKWPEEVAKDLAVLGLRCVELRRKDRPDLKGHVLPALERLKEIAEKVCGFEDGSM